MYRVVSADRQTVYRGGVDDLSGAVRACVRYSHEAGEVVMECYAEIPCLCVTMWLWCGLWRNGVKVSGLKRGQTPTAHALEQISAMRKPKGVGASA